MRPKLLGALVLLGGAVVFMVHTYNRTHPALKSEMPVADQQIQNQVKEAENAFQAGIEKMNLTPDQRGEVNAFVLSTRRRTTPAKRKALQEELRKVLSAEQLSQLADLNKAQKEAQAQIRKQRDEKLMRMLGPRDYQKLQENNKIRRTRQKTRQAPPQATQTPEGQPTK